jgi:hypothetical protein
MREAAEVQPPSLPVYDGDDSQKKGRRARCPSRAATFARDDFLRRAAVAAVSVRGHVQFSDLLTNQKMWGRLSNAPDPNCLHRAAPDWRQLFPDPPAPPRLGASAAEVDPAYAFLRAAFCPRQLRRQARVAAS